MLGIFLWSSKGTHTTQLSSLFVPKGHVSFPTRGRNFNPSRLSPMAAGSSRRRTGVAFMTSSIESQGKHRERAVLSMSPLHSATEEPKVPESSPLAPTGFISIFQIFQFSHSFWETIPLILEDLYWHPFKQNLVAKKCWLVMDSEFEFITQCSKHRSICIMS